VAVTIHDVAREAGVSISTVSKVLNGSTRISGETSVRVKAVMARLKYHPNSIARAFVQQSSGSIAVLMEMYRDSAFSNPYQYEILGGIEEALHERGYLLSLANITDEKNLASLLEGFVRSKRVDGYILHARNISRATIDFLEDHEASYIIIGETHGDDRPAWVDADNEKAGRMAAEHLIARGRRSVAFIGAKPGDTVCERRKDGAEAALERAGLPLLSGLATSLEEELKAVFRRGPDALICASNFVAAAAYRAARAAGRSIPADLAVIGFDGYPLAPYLDPPLSVVDMNLYAVGAVAGRGLLAGIKGGRGSISGGLVEPELIPRASSAS
jgi:DNA-binding LacI/PurR family transcriptional regulator